MSPDLKELLFLIRQHSAFGELLKAIPAPEPKHYRHGKDGLNEQMADWIHRSGRRQQHSVWLSFLTEGEPSQQENP